MTQASSYLGLLPLGIVALTALLAIVLDLRDKPCPRRQNSVTVTGLVLAALSYIPVQMALHESSAALILWDGISYVDSLAVLFGALACLTGALVLLFSIDYLENRRSHPGEFITLVPFVVLGLITAVSTKELLTFFLSFELMSLPLYLMAAWGRFNLKSSEAGFKYFINGAVASAVMFYGISLIFGTVGTTFMNQIPVNFHLVAAPRHAFVLGCIMVLGALFFKIAIAPFHMWAPDVYDGAPSPAAMFLSTAPKATVIAFLLRLVWGSFCVQDMEFTLDTVWNIALCSVAIVSMCWGNLAALKQTSIKRLMAYSGIAQIGYTMLGVMAAARTGAASEGAAAAIFYILMYSFANVAVWAVICLMSYQRRTSAIADYRGLAATNPFLAFTLLIAFFSLAGAPPLAGFVGKFYLFRATVVDHSAWWWVVLIGLINSVISLYYYFGVLKPVFFGKPVNDEGQPDQPLLVSQSVRLGLSLCLIVLTVVAFCPGLIQYCLQAGNSALAAL